MSFKRASNRGCTPERLEEVFSSTRNERSHAVALQNRSGTQTTLAESHRPHPFPPRPAHGSFPTRWKHKQFPRVAPRRQGSRFHSHAQSGGEEHVETGILSWLLVSVCCASLLIWLIRSFAQIVTGLLH